jgi:hypothetical protein
MLVGEQHCAAGHCIQRSIIGITRIVAQPFANPAAALVNELGDIIERQSGIDHCRSPLGAICDPRKDG